MPGKRGGQRGGRGGASRSEALAAPAQTSAAVAAQKQAQGAMKLPLREEDLFKSVMKSFESKQFDKALTQADKILERFPYHGETLAMKGLTMINFYEEEKREEAFQLVKLGLSLNIRSSICWHVFGLFHRFEKNFADACKAYRQAIECKPLNTQLLRDLPAMEAQIRDYPKLVQSRLKLLELQANKESYWLSLVAAVSLNTKPQQALTILDTFLNQYKEIYGEGAGDATKKSDQFDRYQMSELYVFRAGLLEQAGRLQDAVDYLLHMQQHITDKYTLRARLVDLLIRLDRHSQAERIAKQLISMNPENLRFHQLLFAAKRISLPLTGAQLDEMLAYYDELAAQFPREDVPRRQPLEWLPAADPRFRSRAELIIRDRLRKGVPSLFKSLTSLFVDADKLAIVGELVQGYLASLETAGRFPDDDQSESPVTLLWTHAFLAQYYDLVYQPSLALHHIERAIEHTPTVLELYVFKSKIYEHQGDYVQAAEIYDFARQLDLADRNINTRCVKRMLRINRIDAANELIALFTRDGDPPQHYLYDMQCMWFELATADAYLQRSDLGPALKKYVASYTHFQDFILDQMDFHEYCARRAQLNSYVAMIHHCDALRSHPQFLRAVTGIARCYTLLHDSQVGAVVLENLDKFLTPKELAKKRADEAGEKELASRQVLVPRRTNPNKRKKASPLHPVEKDPRGAGLLTASPLAKAEAYLKEAAPFSAAHLPFQQAAFEVYIRQDYKRVLLALRCVKRALAIDANDAQTHYNLVRLWFKALSLPETVPALVRDFLLAELALIVGSGFATTSEAIVAYNQQFADKHRDSLAHLLAAARSIRLLTPERSAAFVREHLLACHSRPSLAHLAEAFEAHAALKNAHDLNQPDELPAFCAHAHERFPYVPLFKPPATQ